MNQAASKVKKELKKAIVIYFVILFRHFSGETGENHDSEVPAEIRRRPSNTRQSRYHFSQLVPEGKRCERQGKK
jgi:hypothetical protein